MSIESHRANQKRWALAHPEYAKKWKHENREHILSLRRPTYRQEWLKHREKTRLERVNKTAMIQEAKNKPCMDCGIKYHPYIMHFDHRDPSTKRKSLAQMGTYSLAHIREEIAKCDVVCANCHGMRTYAGITTGKIKTFGRYYAIT